MNPDPATVLLLKPSSLGDIVHTLPSAALLRRRWPEARLIWMVNPEWAPLLESNPLHIEPWIFRRKEFGGLGGLLRCRKWIQERPFPKPDLALDFQGLLRSALIGRLTRPKRFLGLSDAREGAGIFYHGKVKVEREHAVDRYWNLALEAAGHFGEMEKEWPLPEGQPVADVPERFVLLHPFSRGHGKSLDAKSVALLCEMLQPHSVALVGRSEETLPAMGNVVNLLNHTSLPQLIWLLRKASYVISVDSGPMHLAAALTSRLVSIHMWSDPRLVGPYAPQAKVWKGGRLQTMAGYQPVEGNQPPTPAALHEIAESVRAAI